MIIILILQGDVDLTLEANHIPHNSSWFKYKANLIGNIENNGRKNDVKIALPLKYFSNFWRSLEMPLINWKVELSLKWHENFRLSSAGTATTFKRTDAKLYVPIVTLKTEDNTKLSKLLREGFKRPIYWNKYTIIFKNIIMNIEEKNLMLVFKGLIDFLFLLMQVVIMLLMKIHIENIFFQDLK